MQDRFIIVDGAVLAVIFLSFMLAVGFLLIILSCALWSNWLPLLVGEKHNRSSSLVFGWLTMNTLSSVALTFVLAPLPNALFAHCTPDDFISSSDYDTSSPAVDLGRFITSCTVVTGFGLPLILQHAEIIKPAASYMSIAGGACVYGTILAYSSVFKQESEEF